MTMTWMIWLMLWMALLASAAAPIVALILMYKTTTRVLRISSERLGIPSITMENSSKQEEPKVPAPKKKVLMSVPLPGSSLFRKAE